MPEETVRSHHSGKISLRTSAIKVSLQFSRVQPQAMLDGKVAKLKCALLNGVGLPS
jgi:hypothetical protein